MPRITDIPQTWQTVGPLANPETWQCTDGKVAISTAAAPGVDDGIILWGGRGWDIAAGKTVKYRQVGESAAVISREER